MRKLNRYEKAEAVLLIPIFCNFFMESMTLNIISLFCFGMFVLILAKNYKNIGEEK